MKKLLYSTLICISALSSSCADFLDEDLKSSLAPENTYTSTQGFEVGVTGLYMYARWEFQTWNEGPKPHGACPYELFQIGTDLCFAGSRDGSLVPFEDYTFGTSTGYVKSFWEWAYGFIASSNLILEYSEKSNVNWDKPTDKTYYQAEARFFRAYAYRYLIYLYGDVPWVEKVQKDFQLDFTRTPREEVLQNMVKDLEFAIEHLPQDPDKLKPGRLTAWAAKHMLSEICILTGDYAKAESLAQDVINNGPFKLMDKRFGKVKDLPGDCFADMFKEYNQNRTSGNLESIWVIQLEYNTVGGGGSYADWTKRAWVPKYWNIDGCVIADTIGGRGLGQIVPFQRVLDTYEDQDMRNSEYNIKRNWYYNDPKSPKYGERIEITEALIKNGSLFPTTTKFFYGVPNDPNYNGNNKDRMRFRLAETYLLCAEAQIMQNKKADAATTINVIRARANATPATADEVNIDFLLDERTRELLGEELRRFTLLRTGKLYERTMLYNPYSAKNMKEYNTLWPIPQSVIDANTEAEFPQNPGYSK